MWHNRLLVLLLLAAFAVCGSVGAGLLRRPLCFVAAEHVAVLPRDGGNIIMDIMAVDQFLGPRPVTVGEVQRRSLRRWLRQWPTGAAVWHCPDISPQQQFLLTGQAVAFDSIDRAYFHTWPEIIRNDSLPMAERRDAGQRFLDAVGNIFATDCRENVYVNLYENCTANISLGKLRLTLDVISEYPDGPMVKVRVGGLPSGQIPLTLRLRLPHSGGPMPTFHINGRPIPSPVVEDGYLVVSRKWRNNEEVFFYAEPVAPL